MWLITAPEQAAMAFLKSIKSAYQQPLKIPYFCHFNDFPSFIKQMIGQ